MSKVPDLPRAKVDPLQRSRLLDRGSRNASDVGSIPEQLRTPSSKGDKMMICGDENTDNDIGTFDGSAECEYVDG